MPTIYFSLSSSIMLNRLPIHLGDIATIYCTDNALKQKIEDIDVPLTLSNDKQQGVVTALKIIELITRQEGNIQINPIGSEQVVVYYKPLKEKKSFSKYFKSIILIIVAFFGTGYSIMSYNGDVDTNSLLNDLYKLFTGDSSVDSDFVLNCGIISYSLGLCIGMIIFFNHGINKNSQYDPTPLEVQMRSYEQEVNNCIVVNSERKKETIDVN